MEGYTSLYRKLRPARFSEIIGQPHIARIMVNALISGRIGHAYLFSGPRGTGKTTTAKILAKAVNCLNPQAAEPCNECEACLRIGKGRSLDVMEIDGASNRGIDEIRELREKVRLAPAEEKYKVYIIDEVHMLTGEAFNALLKTLEEPPARVLFILATTEPHKVPDTIISRCLRLDFRRISQTDMAEYLEGIAQRQNIDVEKEAIALIAKMARGGLRDALSIFEQCMAFNEDRISQQDVEAILGKAGDKVIKVLFDCIAAGDVAGALRIVEESLAIGSDIGHLFNDILEYIRNLLLLGASDEARYLIPYSEEIVREMYGHMEQFPKARLFEMADIVSDYARQVRWVTQPQIILELAVIKLCEFSVQIEGSADAGTARHETAAAVEAEAPALELTQPRKVEQVRKERPQSGDRGIQHLDGGSESIGEIGDCAAKTVKAPDSGCEHTRSLNLEFIKGEWDSVLRKLKKQKVSLYALVVEGTLAEYDDGVLTIAFHERFKFHKETAQQAKNKSFLESLLQEHFQKKIRVKFAMKGKDAFLKEEGKDNPGAAGEQDIVARAKEIFGGELVSIDDIKVGDGSQDEEVF